MRIEALHVVEFKNLINFDITFDESSSYTVLVGENGAGKSNVIEAVAWIFRALDLQEAAAFGFSITYRCRGRRVHASAIRGERPNCFIVQFDGQMSKLSRVEFMKEDDRGGPLYRPAFVFGYYSGPSDRLAEIFERHKERFYHLIIQPSARRLRRNINSNALRRLFYAETLHGQFALLAFFMQEGKDGERDREFIRERLQIEDLDSILFALQQPSWRAKGGDPRFWNVEGEVRDFLSALYNVAVAPLRMQRRIPVDLASSPSREALYLFLSGKDALAGVFKSYGSQYAFFTALESTHISKVLSEVRARVQLTRVSESSQSLTYRELSEGEQQLLLVLGLLKFTAEDETLFLLDEPDTHLNPAWAIQYLSFLDRFIRRPESCHILMTTHDPLVFSSLRRNEVRIMRRIDGMPIAETPDEDPRGMGVAGILTSELFRLRSTLDIPTQEELDRMRFLSEQTELSDANASELRILSLKLRRLGLIAETRDPVYAEFIKAWNLREDPSWASAVQLTPSQQAAQSALANEIVDELQKEMGPS